MSNPTLDSKPRHPHAVDDGGPPNEKRRHPRVAVAVRCWITDARRTVYLRVHDLSRGGLSVRATVPFAPHEQIDVGIELPDGRFVRARGEVVWVRSSGPDPASGAANGGGPRMGARFLEFVEGEEELYKLLGNA